MPAKMHQQKVKAHDVGVDDDGEVYRYLVCCKRCSLWQKPDSGVHGTCEVTGERRAGQALSCMNFVGDANAEIDILCETDRLDGKMVKIIVRGREYYLSPEDANDVENHILSF